MNSDIQTDSIKVTKICITIGASTLAGAFSGDTIDCDASGVFEEILLLRDGADRKGRLEEAIRLLVEATTVS